MTDTFQLTAVNESKLRRTSSAYFRLPTLKILSPSRPAPSQASASHSSKHHKSSSYSSHDFSAIQFQPLERDRAQERLRKIDQSVEEDFDRLFGVDRDKLLYKARSLERSPHTREQLFVLENHVLSSKKQLNSLRSLCQSKTKLLEQASDALAVRVSQREAQNIEDGRALKLLEALDGVSRKLEGEEAEMRKLLHMKAYRREALTCAHEPFERLKTQMSQQSSQLQEAIQATYHAESEARAAQQALELASHSLLSQRFSHTHSFESKATEYRHRREFLEMYKRSRNQRELKGKIKENEEDLRAIESFVEKKTEAESVGRALREFETKAKTHETLFGKLGEVASAYEINDIVDYWHYLQMTRTRLESQVRDDTSKLESLRRELQVSKSEFTESSLKLSPSRPLPSESIEAFLSRLAARNRDLDSKKKELEVWGIYASQVESSLRTIASSFAPQKKQATVEEMAQAVIAAVARD